MKEINFTVKVENVFDFFNDDYEDVDYFFAVKTGCLNNHEIAEWFVEAVKNGEVKNVHYSIYNADVKNLKKGDVNFSFEMNNTKYLMDHEMDPYFAMEIIDLFKRTAFKFIHKKPEKLNSLIKRFKNGHCLGLEDQFDCCGYDVENVIGVEDNILCPNKYYDEDSGENDYTNVTDEDVMNTFVFTWYNDYSPFIQKSDDEINEIIEKNGGVIFYVDYKHYDLEGHIKDLNSFTYNELNKLVEEQLEAIRYIVTATYFKEEEEKNEEKS